MITLYIIGFLIVSGALLCYRANYPYDPDFDNYDVQPEPELYDPDEYSDRTPLPFYAPAWAVNSDVLDDDLY